MQDSTNGRCIDFNVNGACSATGTLRGGRCTKHYMRWYRHGDASETKQAAHGRRLSWIAETVRNPPEGCAVFESDDVANYGVVYVEGARTGAHVLALMLATGEGPNNRMALHSCDNPPCCNPRHLRWGTNRENGLDMDRRDRRVTKPVQGEAHGKAKLDEETVRQIRALRASGRGVRSLAREFGMDSGQISRICTGKRWAHLS